MPGKTKKSDDRALRLAAKEVVSSYRALQTPDGGFQRSPWLRLNLENAIVEVERVLKEEI